MRDDTGSYFKTEFLSKMFGLDFFEEKEFEKIELKKITHEEIRETFKWGTRGVNMDQPVRQVLLKDIDDTHLGNIITYVENIGNVAYDQNREELLNNFNKEKEYRKENNIKVIGNLLNKFKIGE